MNFDFLELTSNLLKVHNSRIAVRNVAFCDGWPLFVATKNPLFNKHLMWPQPTEDHQTLQRMELIMDAVERGRMSAVSVVSKDTGEWIGLFRFQPHESGGKNLEIGFWCHDKFWNGRYGLEIGDLCVNAAFQFSDVERVYGFASPENRASCLAMQRGGSKPGKVIVRMTEDHRPLELQEFVVTRDDWFQRSKISARDLLASSKSSDLSLANLGYPRVQPKEDLLLEAA